MIGKLGAGIGLGTLSCLLLTLPAGAQVDVTSDGTVGTVVNYGAGTYTITGGQLQQGNMTLLHSFDDFSLNTNTETIHFDLGNASYGGVTNVIGRVTGGNPSILNGQLRLTGGSTPNLFLINPSGIVFGAGATLDVPGSFVASTAASAVFDSGATFGVDGSTPSPLLSISAPIGLQMGSNPGAITVQGAGSSTVVGPFSVLSGLLSPTGLRVQPGKTLALVGGDVDFNGGVVRATSGRIELGSVTSGRVDISSAQGLRLSYGSATGFGSIQMTAQSLAAVPGTGNGSIQIQGGQVSVRGGSIVALQNIGSQGIGNITVNATESLQVLEPSANFQSFSGVISEAVSTGAGGNIIINTPQLTIDQSSYVLARTLFAQGGDVTVNANNIFVGGVAPGHPSPSTSFSVLMAATFGSGSGGNFYLNTQNLTVVGSGNTGTRTFGTGRGGNVNVQADTVRISSAGTGNDPGLVSLLSANSFGAGHAGNLYLNTRALSIQDGGVVSVSTVSTGDAGSLFINASESIDVSGIKNASNPSYIGAVARVFASAPNPNPNSLANAGNITINTPVLSVRNGGTVIVENQVAGNAGTLTLNANTVFVDNGSQISASTRLGEGGNLNLQLRSGLIMRHGSLISATAGGAGNGGDIIINAPVIAGFENSDIIANAFQGQGGNIQITTQGIFGLQFRAQLTSENDITASSRFGVNGTVTISTPGIDPGSSLVELPADLSDSSQQIAEGCAANSDNSFTATGRGGVPLNPSEGISSDTTWNDTRDLSAFMDKGSTGDPAAFTHNPTDGIVEISGWQINSDGQVELIATPSSPIAANVYATCSG